MIADEVFADHTYAPLVQEDLLEAQRNGVLGSPALFINDVRVEGLRPLAELQRIADEQLSKKLARANSHSH